MLVLEPQGAHLPLQLGVPRLLLVPRTLQLLTPDAVTNTMMMMMMMMMMLMLILTRS
jgi:hypothetical protein